jgi:prevent-host-death family protein
LRRDNLDASASTDSYNSYLLPMSTHSVADAKNQLSKLIDRAVGGEAIVITRRGQSVIELKPMRPPPRPMAKEDLDWLRARRANRERTRTDAGTLLRELRDKDWQR